MLFPLRLTPFEEYMLMDSHPVYPMSCFSVLKFEGQFNAVRFEKALQQTLERHPLFNCVVEETKKNRFCWQPSGKKIEIFRSKLGADQKLPRSLGIALFREPALKVTLCNDSTDSAEVLSGRTDVLLESHHSACDGGGMFRFIEDLLYEYVRPNQPPKRRPVEPLRLLRRGKFGWSFGETITILPKQFWGIFRAWTFLMHKIMPLTATPLSAPEGSLPPAGFPAVISRELPEEQTQRIRRMAKQRGITMNDWLLCAVFDAVKRWQETKGFAETGFIRIAVPTNLRSSADAVLPAANKVSMVFIDRKRKEIEDTAQFYEGVHKEMQHIKRCHLGWAFIHGLTVYKRLFGSFRGIIQRSRCWSTATVSNLGTLFNEIELPVQKGRIQLDDTLELTGMIAAPPVRCGTALGVCTLTYGNRLTVCLHYDTAAVERVDAEEILNRIDMYLAGGT